MGIVLFAHGLGVGSNTPLLPGGLSPTVLKDGGMELMSDFSIPERVLQASHSPMNPSDSREGAVPS